MVLEDFVKDRSMTRKRKWSLLISVDIMLLISFMMIDYLPAKILIVLIFIFKHYYFYRYIRVI